MPELVRNYTFWYNKTEKQIRKFLVVDIPFNEADTVVLLELLPYKEEEPHKITRIPYPEWIQLTEEKKTLKPFVPKL